MTNPNFQCRSCRGTAIQPILSLGNTPLANALLSPEQLNAEEKTFPLDLVFCNDCSLVQITETVPPEELFRDYYYFSSFSDGMLEHSRVLANRLADERSLSSDSLVVEVASNDGYLLKNYVQRGIPVLGVEPARNIAKVANENGVNTRADFFGIDCARALVKDGLKADVIHAHNVLAHVADLNGVVEGFRALVEDDGLVLVEFPYLVDMVEDLAFDTIYHEHLCYFSLTAIDKLFRRHDLIVTHVERYPIHCGTLRIFASPAAAGIEPDETVRSLLAEETAAGVDTFKYYGAYMRRIADLKNELAATLKQFRSAGKRIVAYGASAKGSTLLNFFGINGTTLDYVVDRSTVKQGKFTPGTHLQICPPERLQKDRPDYVLLLTWNFRDEILAQQRAYRDQGGKFIVPIPKVEVV